MNLKGKVTSLAKSRFVQNAAKLATGTALAQLLALAFLPILTRTYSQEAFGLLAAFSAVVGFVSSFVTLKYDTALVLPKEDQDAYSLLKLSNIVTVIITIICVLIMSLPITYFEEYRGLEILIGTGVLLSVNYNNSALWNIRFKHFNSTSIAKVVQSVAIFAFQFLLYSWYDLKGLVIGNLLGITISGLYLIVTRKFDWKIYRGVTQNDMLVQAKRYIDFPKYFTLSNAVLSFSTSLPVLLFVKYIPLAQIGIYGIALRIIGQPVTLISNSLRSVILGDMADKRNDNKPIIGWYLKIFVGLFIVSLLASLGLFMFSDYIVTLFLGQEWIEAGLYIRMLLPLLISMMIASPGTAAVRVFEMQKYTLRYSIVALGIKASTLFGLFTLQIVSFEFIILIYSIVNLVLVLANNSIILLKIRQYEKQIQYSTK